MSAFDPSQFLDITTTETNSKRPPLPAENPASPDGLYTAVIGEVKATSGEKDGKAWVSMVIPLKVEVPQQVQDQLGIKGVDSITLTDRAFLDLTAQGTIDNSPGKNRRQRVYRDATGTNTPGEPFSWRMLTGRPVKLKLAHRIYEGEIQEDIATISKL